MLHTIPIGLWNPVTGYTIDNAILLNGTDEYLSRSFGTGGDTQTYTISFWCKLTHPDTSQWPISAGTTDNDRGGIQFAGGGANILQYFNLASGTDTDTSNGAAYYRDFSGWLHVVVAVDTTNVTAGDRFRIYVNGVEDDAGTGTDPALNHNTNIGSNTTHAIGRRQRATPDLYFSGYLAEFIYIDGQQLTPSSFGETASNGGWVPVDPSELTYGTKGFYLDFSNSAALGTDASGNGNNWTLNNIDSTNHVTDVPTDGDGIGDSAVWNTLHRVTTATPPTLSNGNKTMNDSGSTGEMYFATIPCVYDCVLEGAVSSVSTMRHAVGVYEKNAGAFGDNGLYWRFRDGGVYINNSFDSTIATVTAGDDFRVEVDISARSVELFKNNVSQGSFVIGGTEELCFVGGTEASTGDAVVVYNFGDGGFTDTPTSGFKALNTGNMTDVSGALSDVFVDATDTGANIEATLDAKHSFISYLKVYRDRTGGSWQYRFSFDSSNAHVTGATNTHGTFTAPSGANAHYAYAINTAATGISAGSESHTNGVATTVTHNLGNTKAVIILFSRTAATEVKFYHPAQTSGSLQELTGLSAEAADTDITNVTANAFDIGSGAATATYDYIIMTEACPFFNAFDYEGNASTNGAFGPMSIAPQFGTFFAMDSDHTPVLKALTLDSGHNPLAHHLPLDSTGVQASASETVQDFVFGGTKNRSASSSVNEVGTINGWSFGHPIANNPRAQ